MSQGGDLEVLLLGFGRHGIHLPMDQDDPVAPVQGQLSLQSLLPATLELIPLGQVRSCTVAVVGHAFAVAPT